MIICIDKLIYYMTLILQTIYELLIWSFGKIIYVVLVR